MASFVTLDEYSAYVGGNVNYASAEFDLDAACDRVRDYLCQQIDLVTNDVVTLHGSDVRAMLLPELPVVSVASVVLDATTLNPAETITGFTVDDYGVLWRTAPYWWLRGATYTVTYTHGYAASAIPSILKVAVFKLAQAAARAPGVRQESVGPFSVSYDSETVDVLSGLGLDRRIVKRVPVP